MSEAVTRSEVDFDPKAFARRVYRGEVFLSDMVKDEDARLLAAIFMPLMMMTNEQRDQMLAENVSCLYGEMSQAMDRGINGYPMFMTFCTLSADQHKAFIVEYMRLLKLLDE